MSLKIKEFFHETAGFTLIESLVVIAIILVLTVVALANYRAGEKSLALEHAAAKLNQDIRRMEEWAISAKEYQGIIPNGGYGVYAVAGNDYYTLFADSNGSSETIEDVSLGQYVKINSVSPSPMSVVFSPPHPTVTIWGGASEATIILVLKTDSTKTRNIKINQAGLIETY